MSPAKHVYIQEDNGFPNQRLDDALGLMPGLARGQGLNAEIAVRRFPSSKDLKAAIDDLWNTSPNELPLVVRAYCTTPPHPREAPFDVVNLLHLSGSSTYLRVPIAIVGPGVVHYSANPVGSPDIIDEKIGTQGIATALIRLLR